MLKKPPHILITTPESLAIALAAKQFSNLFSYVQWVIVDEVHSQAENKRGVHLSLSLERLQELSEFARIGLSATVSPLDEVAKFLVGRRYGRVLAPSVTETIPGATASSLTRASRRNSTWKSSAPWTTLYTVRSRS
jgi:Lhr-like helicase